MYTGTPIHKISIPASIHTDKSGLQVQQEVLFSNYASLKSFDSIHSLKDPIDRLAAVVAGMIDPHTVWDVNKPFNPVLGIL